ncbi:MAG: DUF1080 domain-containing protein [Flavihumibacter sp.]
MTRRISSLFVIAGSFFFACQEPAANGHATTTLPAADSFVSIFDGKTLSGWVGDTSFWKVVDGAITAEETPEQGVKTNSFLIYEGTEPADFELKAEYRISEGGNSGVQYRSELVEGIPFALKGYQADIDGGNVYTGQLYEERGRGFLAMRGQITTLPAGEKPVVTGSAGDSDSLKTKIRPNDWNELHIVAKGNHLQHYINGVLMSETTDNDTAARKAQGLIGLQLHVMPAMKVAFRNIRLHH